MVHTGDKPLYTWARRRKYTEEQSEGRKGAWYGGWTHNEGTEHTAEEEREERQAFLGCV